MSRTPEPSGPISPWAFVSLVSSLAFLCPLGCLLGPLFGVRALVEIRASPGIRGRRLAVAGIALGAVGAAFWVFAALWWQVHAREPMLRGPAAELVSGLDGDVGGFKAGFFGPGRVADDLEAAAFLADLRQRYGRFIQARQDRESPVGGERWRPRIPYVLRFESQEVAARAEFVILAEGRRWPLLKFGWLAVYDDRLGDLVYPSSAEGAARPPEPPEPPEPAEPEESEDGSDGR